MLVKRAESLERLSQVDTVVFDKTGTLTEGQPVVTDIVTTADFSESEVLRMAASLEKKSEHPLAGAVLESAERRGLELAEGTEFEAVPGFGVKGVVSGQHVAVGSGRLMKDMGIKSRQIDGAGATNDSAAKTDIFLAVDGELKGVIRLQDPVKEGVPETIRELQHLGVEVLMFTGDGHMAAQAVGVSVGVDRFYSEMLPSDKRDKIEVLRDEGRVVAMVGDGINDAPALAQADVGIAIGTGTDVAIESADITISGGDIGRVVAALHLGRRTMRTIKQNLVAAFIYNILGIPLAAGVLYPFWGILLSPVVASAAMAASSVSVVSNSLRLRRLSI